MKPYIKSLSSKGLKSGDFEHELSRVNLFIGKSASGKTARIEALRLALLGRVPDLGKQKSSTLQLSRNGTIEVSISDSMGRYRMRKFSGESKIQVEGNLPDAPEVLLDPNVYFGLSDEKKVEYAFSLIQLTEPECFKAIDEPVKRIAGEPVQKWIVRAIESLKLSLKDVRANADRLSKSVQVNVQFQGTPPNNPAEQIKQARKALEDAKIELARLNAEHNAALTADAKLYEIGEELKTSEPNRVAECEAQIEAAQKQIKQFSKQTANKEFEKASDTFKAIDEQLQSLGMSNTDTLTNWVKHETQNLHELRRQDDTLNNDYHETRKEMLAACKKATSPNLMLCSECGGPISEDKILAKYGKQLAEIMDLREKNKAAQEKLLTEIKEWETKRDKESELDEKRKALTAERLQARDEWNKASEEFNAKEKERKVKLATANSTLQAYTKALSQAHESASNRGQSEALKTKLEAQLAERSIANIEVEIANVEAQIKSINTTLVSLEKNEREYASYRADEERNSKTILERKNVEARKAELESQIEAFETVRANMIETAMGSILKTVNKFTKCIPDMTPIEYQNGEIGRWYEEDRLNASDASYCVDTRATWIPHSAFSGTEKALTYAGISAALAKDAPILIVLLDEMGRFDPGTVQDVLETMVQLTKDDEIGQFIGCISWPIDWVKQPAIVTMPKGVNVIEV